MRTVAGALPFCALMTPGAPPGLRVAFHGLGAVGNFPYSSPYENLRLK